MAAFYNQATLSYNGNVTNSNIVQGDLVESLTASKTAVNSDYNTGDILTYAVSMVNSGSTPYSGLSLSDDLGAYSFNNATVTPLNYVADSVRYYVNGELQAAPATVASPFSVSGVNVPAGGNALLLYSAQANEFAPLGGTAAITNTATLSGAGLAAPITADVTVGNRIGPDLSISKSLNPTTVTGNDPLTYTLLIQNDGGTSATTADNIIISDTFDPILNITEVRFNDALWASPANYTYNAATGEFTTAAGQISVPAASYTQDPATGAWSTTPGISRLTITGTL